jgi:hypothetical protein
MHQTISTRIVKASSSSSILGFYPFVLWLQRRFRRCSWCVVWCSPLRTAAEPFILLGFAVSSNLITRSSFSGYRGPSPSAAPHQPDSFSDVFRPRFRRINVSGAGQVPSRPNRPGKPIPAQGPG